MKKIKYIISLLLLFMVVGFAAISASLSIKGKTTVATTLDDFKVYFSNVLVDGNQDLSLVQNDTKLYFDVLINEIGDTRTITYDVTNGSKYYDANISISCTPSNEYLTITNNFNTTDNLSSKETRSGTLSLTKKKTIASETVKSNQIICTLTVTPVERTTINDSTPHTPVNPYYIGREVAIGDEKFNVISSDEDTVTMLAQYNIGEDYKQSTSAYAVYFSNDIGWDNTPAPKEIDIQNYADIANILLNNYVLFLQQELSDETITGDFISLIELGELGCTIPISYVYPAPSNDLTLRTCKTSPHTSWLINGHNFWTRSSLANDKNKVWKFGNEGDLYSNQYNKQNGVRPIITISKDLYHNLIDYYKIGREVAIGEEKFNVISDNGTTVTMLAKKPLAKNYLQSTVGKYVTFSETIGWENIPGPKEIDIQTWGGESKTYINNYVEYLQSETNATILIGDLISLNQLKKIGCNIPSEYSWETDELKRTCANSEYKSWLLNQNFWTKSALADHTTNIWILTKQGTLTHNKHTETYAIRPVITISKDAL